MLSFGVSIAVVHQFIKQQCKQNMLDPEQTSILLVYLLSNPPPLADISLEQKNLRSLSDSSQRRNKGKSQKITKERWVSATKKVKYFTNKATSCSYQSIQSWERTQKEREEKFKQRKRLNTADSAANARLVVRIFP